MPKYLKYYIDLFIKYCVMPNDKYEIVHWLILAKKNVFDYKTKCVSDVISMIIDLRNFLLTFQGTVNCSFSLF